jgi:murein DD-endopeptidase MepM/ murein hydrolase activator NlpD
MRLRTNLVGILLAVGLAWPLQGPISTYYGEAGPLWRLGYHPGLDLAVPDGTPIDAAAGGRVLEAGWDKVGGYGNHVKIDHGDGLVTIYAHMSVVLATTGEEVFTGQLIGLVGSTGVSTGPHLHFEVRRDGRPQDPLEYLPG